MRSTTVVISDNARHLRGTGGEAQTCTGTVAGHSAACPEHRGHTSPVVLYPCNQHEQVPAPQVRAHFSS